MKPRKVTKRQKREGSRRKACMPTQNGPAQLEDGDKNYRESCQVCDAKPTVHPTSLCGPCCFGEAETAGGNW